MPAQLSLAAMAINDKKNQGGKGGGVAAPVGKLDLLSHIQSEKQLLEMQLADKAGKDNIGAEAHDDEDPIEGVRNAMSGLSGPPLNIAFQSFNDNGVGDGSQADNDNNFPRILHSPSSISWNTFKERGQPNTSPFPDAEAERGNERAIQEFNAGKKSAVWEDPVFGVRDSRELEENKDVSETALDAVDAATQRQSITRNKADEDTYEKGGPSVRREIYGIAENVGYTTEPEPTKKEKAGFGFSKVLRKKKTRTSSKRKNKNESRDKKAPARAMFISEDEDERALLPTFNTSSSSVPAKEKGILNLRQRVFNLGKSRQPKKLPHTPTSKANNVPEQLHPLQHVPSTPVKTSNNSSNDNHPYSSMSTPVANNKEKQAEVPTSTPTPATKKLNLEKENDNSRPLATVVVTPIKEVAPRQDAKKTCGLTPPPKDTPKTSAAPSDCNLSPEVTSGGRSMDSPQQSTKAKKVRSDGADRPMMLPPAMPPSMVSCKTSEDEAEEESIGATGPTASKSGSSASKASIEAGTTSNHSCASSQKEDPPSESLEPGEKVSKLSDPPGATFEGALSWGVLSAVLSEEGYENPSTYTIPNPMPDGWPADDTEDNVDNAQGNTEGDVDKDAILKVAGDDCSSVLSKESAKCDTAADIDEDPTLANAYIVNGHKVIGTSANFLLEVSSTAHTEAYEDNIEIKCMGMKAHDRIEEENDKLLMNENENGKEEERSSSGVHSSKSTTSNTDISVARTSKTQESSETDGSKEARQTENTRDNHADSATTKVPLRALLESTSKPREPSTTPLENETPTKQKSSRGRLGRSKIREAVMSVRNVTEHRSKSREVIRIRARSKSRGPSIKSGKSGKRNIGKRLGLKRRQSDSGETSKDGKDTDEKCPDDLTTPTGLSIGTRELLEQARDSPDTVDDLDVLIVNPIPDPTQYHSPETGLSWNAKHELAREDLRATLDEIEISRGSDQREKKHRASSNSRLSHNYHSSSEEDEDNSSYNDDSTYDREDSSESTYDHASESSISNNPFNRRKNGKNSDFGNVLDDETEYTEDQGCREDGCRDDEDVNCTSFVSFQAFDIPREEIIEDLKDAFEDFTQMMRSFGPTEGFTAEGRGDADEKRERRRNVRREKSYSNAGSRRKNSESLSPRRMRSERMSRNKSFKSKRGDGGVERDKSRRRRRHRSRGDKYHPKDRHSGSQERYDDKQWHRGYGTTSRRSGAKSNRNAQRTSGYRRMEL